MAGISYSSGFGGGGGYNYALETPYYISNTTSASTLTYVSTSMPVMPAREKTAREWLADQVESVCRKGRL